MKSTAGTGVVTVILLLLGTDGPNWLLAVRLTLYVPGLGKEDCGFFSIENGVQVLSVLSLYCQFQLVGLPVDWSINVTLSGASPTGGTMAKSATGTLPVRFTHCEVVLFRIETPAVLLTVRLTR